MSRIPTPWPHPQHGTYYLRIEVPPDLKDSIGKSWIKKSLRTKVLKEAKPRFAEEYAKTIALFESHRDANHLTQKDADILAARFLNEEQKKLEKLSSFDDWSKYLVVIDIDDPDSPDKIKEIHTLDDISEEYSFALSNDSRRRMEDLEGETVDKILRDSGYKVNRSHPVYLHLLRKVCYHRLEIQRKAVKAYKGQWGTLKDDPLAGSLTTSQQAVKARQETSEPVTGNTLSSLIDSFIDHGIEMNQWEDRTLTEVKLVLDGFKSFIGGGVAPEDIKRDHIRDFRKLLSRLPPRYSNSDRFKNLTLRQITELAAKENMPTLAPATLYKKFTFIVSLFKFATLEEITTTNRAAGINKKPEKEKDVKPYSDQELQKILDYYSDKKDTDNYWIPRLALMGMRQKEIIQLHKNDFKIHKGIHYIELKKIAGDSVGKKLKNRNSQRKVPIPDFLLDAGILEFVKNKQGRLFNVVRYSQKVNKVIDDLGLKHVPGYQKRDFHTIRHTFGTKLKIADVSERRQNLLGGWKGEKYSTGEQYGRDYLSFLETLQTEINKIQYNVKL